MLVSDRHRIKNRNPPRDSSDYSFYISFFPLGIAFSQFRWEDLPHSFKPLRPDTGAKRPGRALDGPRGAAEEDEPETYKKWSTFNLFCFVDFPTKNDLENQKQRSLPRRSWALAVAILDFYLSRLECFEESELASIGTAILRSFEAEDRWTTRGGKRAGAGIGERIWIFRKWF